MNINDMVQARLASTNRQARAQENVANAAAAGQVGASRMASEGNVLANLYSQPANFGSITGDIYGNYGANTGAQGGNYTNAYGAYTAGLGSLGNNSSQNYATLASGLGNSANAFNSQADANSAAEAARQTAIGNIGSSALGAYGGGLNAALGAYGLQQQAYNMAMGQAMNANQNALSSLGQSRNAALGSLGNAYAGLGGAAAQLGGAGLQASQTSRTDNYQDQVAQNRQTTGGRSQDTASMYGGGGGDFSGGYGDSPQAFVANGPDGQIASGSYGGGYGGYGGAGGYGSNAYDMGGSRNAYSETYGTNDSLARNTQRASQVTGPQMDAFRASLAAGMGGINNALGGLASAGNAAMSRADSDAIQGSFGSGMRSLNDANSSAAEVPGQLLDQGLSALLRLGGQGYNNSRRGMDQYYDNASRGDAAQAAILDSLLAGYANSSSQLNDIGSAIGGGYGDTVGNIDSVRDDLTSGYGSANRQVNDLYGGSVGNWMQGNRDPNNYLLPRYRETSLAQKQQDLVNQGWRWDAAKNAWVKPNMTKRGIPGPA